MRFEIQQRRVDRRQRIIENKIFIKMTEQEEPINDPTTSSITSPFVYERYLGTVTKLGATSLQFAFDFEQLDANSTRSLAYRAFVGEHIIIRVGALGIIGQITNIQTSRESSSQEQLNISNPLSLLVFADVDFNNSIDVETGKVFPGIITSPRIGCQVFITDSTLVQAAAEANIAKIGNTKPLTLDFANLPDRNKTRLRFTPEMMFGRHCAVLGTTGGGKSWSLAKIIEETAKLKSKTILFDATGEFSSLNDSVVHLHLGNHPSPPDFSREVVIPYYELNERDLFAVFKPKGQHQAPKLRAAIKSLKLATLVPELALDGTIMKANRSKKEYQTAYKRYYNQVEDQNSAFDIRHLSRQIEHECVRPNRSEMEPQFWGDISAIDHAHCISLINRVKDITTSPNLSPLFNPFGKTSLLKAIEAFISDRDSRVLCISLQYLSFAHHAREIVVNAIGRHLMSMSQAGLFRQRPLLVVVDEAHQFFSSLVTEDNDDYPLDAFALIAKEGRKYALSLCLATQRPRDIPEGVLSQMGTIVVHRLINQLDRKMIESACGEVNHAILDALPGLAPGEAIIVGAGFSLPLQIQIQAPLCPPNSLGADYQKLWR
jgi:uncharacterized protein